MAYNNRSATASFNSSFDLFDDSFDEEDYLTSLAITESRNRNASVDTFERWTAGENNKNEYSDRDVSIDTYENHATEENTKNENSLHQDTSATAARKDSMDFSETFTCPFCELDEDSLYSLESHIAEAHPEMMENASKSELDPHSSSLRFGQSEGSHNFSGDDDDDDKTLPFCPYCDVRLASEVNVLEHIDSVHEEEFLGMSALSNGNTECPICGELFFSAAVLEDHVQCHFSTLDSCNSPDRVSKSSHANEKSLSTCPVCDFQHEDYAILISHVESHFDLHHAPGSSNNSKQPLPSGSMASSSCNDDNSGSMASSSNNSHNSHRQRKAQARGRNAYQNQYRRNLERSVMNGHISPGKYHEMMSEMKTSHELGIDEGQSKVEGLYENLVAAYRQHRQVTQLILCDPTDFYCGSYGDKGWGCGYRNFQMLISCLARIPMYAEKLFPDGDIQVPSVCKLQQIIEGAWQKGFDLEGCAQLGRKLVNTRKWIGATEVVATLSSYGIKCSLVDFHSPSSANGSHPKLFQWALSYYMKPSEHKPPLYLQHQGHSRTIAGFENDNGQQRLVVFDPGTPYHRVAHMGHKCIHPKQLRMFRRTIGAFKARQYQLVAVTGILTPAEYEESKILQSIPVL